MQRYASALDDASNVHAMHTRVSLVQRSALALKDARRGDVVRTAV